VYTITAAGIYIVLCVTISYYFKCEYAVHHIVNTADAACTCCICDMRIITICDYCQ
jgi:hypothetical protein